jgi:hypothetical protein
MKTLRIACAVCILGFASVTAHAKNVCDIHHLGYTKDQCEQCSNMTWSVTRVTPKGECVSTAPPQTLNVRPAGLPPAPPKAPCDIHHLGYTETECDKCSNMTWSVSKVFPRGTCVSTAPPQKLNLTPVKSGGTMPPAAPSNCTPTHWGGATLPLAAPNFSGTGARVGVCSKGFDLAKSQFQCSTGVPAPAFNAPTTNITCNKTTGVGGNTQVTINGTPCCLN